MKDLYLPALPPHFALASLAVSIFSRSSSVFIFYFCFHFSRSSSVFIFIFIFSRSSSVFIFIFHFPRSSSVFIFHFLTFYP